MSVLCIVIYLHLLHLSCCSIYPFTISSAVHLLLPSPTTLPPPVGIDYSLPPPISSPSSPFHPGCRATV